MDRATRKALIAESLHVGPQGDDGWRPVMCGGTEVGLLRRLPEGRWRLDVRLEHWDGWHKNAFELQAQSPEMAEGWALDQVATYIAMTEEVRERDG
jgi:hypothetical protein